jgi:outer membrane protein assembly factor BamD (BamD/ComL family)
LAAAAQSAQPERGSPSADALLAAARRAQTRDRLQRAARLYRQVIDVHPTTPAASVAKVALGRLLQSKLAQPRAAVPLFDAYLRQHRGGELAEEALYFRALSLARLGDRQLAAHGLRELLTSYPSSLYSAPARAKLAEFGE